MPLFSPFTPEEARDWIGGKDGQWVENGYGPWTFYIDGEFVGWGGFQREDDGANYGLVLFPEFWGHTNGSCGVAGEAFTPRQVVST
jgi:hypothetical protein